MAMPPRKWKVPDTEARELGVLPWNWRRQKTVEEKGMRNPKRLRSVGLRGRRLDGDVPKGRSVHTFGEISFRG
jgi:hypothetical protein